MEIDEGYSNIINTVCLFRAPYNTGASRHSGYSVETDGLAEAWEASASQRSCLKAVGMVELVAD